jgi:hypothetical protein
MQFLALISVWVRFLPSKSIDGALEAVKAAIKHGSASGKLDIQVRELKLLSKLANGMCKKLSNVQNDSLHRS